MTWRAARTDRVRRPLNERAPSSQDHRGACNDGARRLKPYPLVIIGAGALPLPTKQPPKLSAVTTKASARATFFIESPFYLRSFVVRQRQSSSVAGDHRPPVQTKKNHIYVRLCIERDGAKYRTVESAAVGAEVRV